MRLHLFAVILTTFHAASSKRNNVRKNQNRKQTIGEARVYEELEAPIAKKIPHYMVTHGDTRIDNYYWMRDDDREDAEVISHLEAENNYVEKVLAHTQGIQENLYEELKGRYVEDMKSPPIKVGSYFYFYEYKGNSEYEVYYRSSDLEGVNMEAILDVNELAEGYAYFSVSETEVSPNEEMLAYSQDTFGNRNNTIKVLDLKTKEYLPDEIVCTNGQVVWLNNNKGFYYVLKNASTLLSHKVLRHDLGTQQSDDKLIYEEMDLSYFTSISKSSDKQVIYIVHSSTETVGESVIDANDPDAQAEIFYPLERGIEYYTYKTGEWHYILTNYKAKNYRLMKVHAEDCLDRVKWQEVIKANDDVLLLDIALFTDHLVYQQRENGMERTIIRKLSTDEELQLEFNDEIYVCSLTGNRDANATDVRISYSSMTTPKTYYNFDLNTGEAKILKQTKVLGGFEQSNYTSERLMLPARDGKEVPVSLVYNKKFFKKDGKNPIYLYGYGSYGNTMGAYFSSNRLSILDRGFVFAIPHIRGSDALGVSWYEDGKLMKKQNTFNDYVDVTKGLVERGYCDENKIFAVGGSAGGLLMGVIANQAPDLYLGIVADVAFVDVVTTMLDESIPLTTNEFDEWGNPKNKTYYDYMLKYSPYDNVERKEYPNMLVTTSLYDSAVGYWEPMKWVAKLRDMKSDNNLLLLETNMEAGHHGSSGRFDSLKSMALEYSFMLDLLEKYNK